MAHAKKRKGLLPVEPEGLFNIDRKLSPVEQLADTEFRVQLNPKGIARYSDMYRNPSKYTGIAYSKPGANISVAGFYMDTPTQTAEGMGPRYGLEPGQLLRQGKSYQVSGKLDQSVWGGKKESPEEVLHHEAFHDAASSAARSEFMDKRYQRKYLVLSSGFANEMGISLAEALARYHDLTYSKSEASFSQAGRWLLKAEKKADKLMESEDSSTRSLGRTYKDILQNQLPQYYAAIEDAAKKRHKALGYK